MSNESINKITVLFSLVLSLISLLVALLTGANLFFMITMRFILVFIISAVLVRIALTIVNLVVVKAAQESIAKLSKDLKEENRLAEEKPTGSHSAEGSKKPLFRGQNLDLISKPQEDLSLGPAADGEENPEIKVFEPFKPRRIKTDKSE